MSSRVGRRLAPPPPQAATTLAFTFLGMAMEGKFHNFEWQKSFITGRKAWRKMLIIYFLIAMLTGAK